MKIIGNGMVAGAFIPYVADKRLQDVLIFASGVSDSSITDPAEYRREQTLLYDSLAQCATHNQRLVYFSSGGAIYGPRNAIRTETSPTYPVTPYGQQQLLCEGVIINSGARYLIIRLPNLVGPSQHPAQLIPALVNQALSGHARLFSKATRDIIDVDDCARLVVELLHRVDSDKIVTVASGMSHPIADIFAIICKVLQVHPEVTVVNKGDQQQFDISKLRRLIGNAPELAHIFSPDSAQTMILKYAPDLVK